MIIVAQKYLSHCISTYIKPTCSIHVVESILSEDTQMNNLITDYQNQSLIIDNYYSVHKNTKNCSPSCKILLICRRPFRF